METKLQQGIIKTLCRKAGEPQSKRQLALALEVSPTAVAKALKPLIEKEIVKAEPHKTMKWTGISLNTENEEMLWRKRIENLSSIYESGLAEKLSTSFPGCAIILFGSYATGEDTVRSDIDIAIIGAKEKRIELSSYEDILERPINLQFFRDFRSVEGNLAANIMNGIRIAGILTHDTITSIR